MILTRRLQLINSVGEVYVSCDVLDHAFINFRCDNL